VRFFKQTNNEKTVRQILPHTSAEIVENYETFSALRYYKIDNGYLLPFVGVFLFFSPQNPKTPFNYYSCQVNSPIAGESSPPALFPKTRAYF